MTMMSRVVSGAALRETVRASTTGAVATIVVALAATYLSDHYHAPVMIFALLIGMALNALSAEPRYAPGIDFCARTLLRISVALLGLRITFAQVGELGWTTAAMVAVAVPLTIAFGWLMARALRLDNRFAVLSGGSVGICGASAAMAIACAWPRQDSERDTVVIIVCISALSTLAMVLYPVLAAALQLDAVQTALLLGGSIHDVAQVVGAGYSVSRETGDIAIVVKLMRVAALLPIVFLIAVAMARMPAAVDGQVPRVTLLPGFLVVFVVLALCNGFGWVPQSLAQILIETSHWLLVISVAALGMKTSARELLAVGRAALLLVVAETTFLALFVAAWIKCFS